MKIVSNNSLNRFYDNILKGIKDKIGSSVPIGTILPFSGEEAPYSYMLCQGQDLSRSEYVDLFNIIGTKYGSDSDTTFKLPDLRGKVITGLDTTQNEFKMLGLTGGEKTHKLSLAELPAVVYADSQNEQYVTYNSNKDNARWLNGRAGSDQPHNNLQPYITTNYIIKVKYDIQTIQNSNIYSLDEVCIGMYLGKPLYRKCFKGNMTPSTNIQHGVKNLESVVSLYGMFADASLSNAYPIPNARPSHQGLRDLGLWVNNNVIGFEVGSDFTGTYPYSLIMEYTKTTD